MQNHLNHRLIWSKRNVSFQFSKRLAKFTSIKVFRSIFPQTLGKVILGIQFFLVMNYKKNRGLVMYMLNFIYVCEYINIHTYPYIYKHTECT